MKSFFKHILFALLMSSAAVPLYAQISTVNLLLPDSLGKKGDTLLYPIYCLDSLKVIDSVLSGEFTIAHDGSVFDVLNVVTVGTMLDSTSSVFFNPVTRKVAFAHTEPITGKGILVYLRIKIKATASGTSSISLSNVMFNEGTPSVNIDAGSMRPALISINPKNPPQNKVVGDSIIFIVNGDVTFPVTWAVSDTHVASIDANGKLIGKNVGTTTVSVTDNQGLSDQSTLLPIFPPSLNSLTVTIRDTSISQNFVFDLPVYISDVSSLGLLSTQFSLTFNQSVLIPIGVVQNGSMTSTWAPAAVNVSPGNMDIALAGADTLNGSGVLTFIRFQVKRFATSSTNITFSNVLFNENISAIVDNGFFSPILGPTININGLSNTLIPGETSLLNATGGTAPYKWRLLSDPTIANIDSVSGLLTAMKGGNVKVAAIDINDFDGFDSTFIHHFRATLPDTSMAFNDSVDVPLLLSDVSGLDILSIEFEIHYDTTNIRFVSLHQLGTLSNGMSMQFKDSIGKVTAAFSGISPLSGSGTFVKLRFKQKGPFAGNTNTLLNFNKFDANEGGQTFRFATTVSGSVFVQPPPNTPPIFTDKLRDTTINENQMLTYQYKATDANGDGLSFALAISAAGMNISTTGFFSWSPNFTQAGQHKVVVSVNDFKQNGLVKDSAIITVLDINNLPNFNRVMGDTTINENQLLTFDIDATDPDGDVVRYFVQSIPAGMTIDTITGVLSWQPNFSQSGVHNIVLVARDNKGGQRNKNVSITVQNVNRPPTFTKVLNDTTILTTQLLQFQYQGSDPDGNQIQFILFQGPGGASLTSGVFSWTPTLTQTGNFRVIVSLTDGAVTIRDTTFVTVMISNLPPLFTASLSDTTISTNIPLQFQYQGNDPENAALQFNLLSGPAGATISSSGLFNWIPANSQIGTFKIIVTLSDGGYVIPDTAKVTVVQSNHAPAFSSTLPDTTIQANTNLQFQFAGNDIDGDTLQFLLVEGPAGCTITSAGIFLWTPAFNQLGIFRLVVGISDGTNTTPDTSFITVAKTNRVPQITQRLGDITIAEAELLDFTYTAVDPDLDTLKWSFVSMAPSGMTLTSSGRLTWTPTFFQAGVYKIVVKVSDAFSTLRDSSIITVTNLNRSPVFLSTLPDFSLGIDSVYSFQFQASDPDSEQLTFSFLKSKNSAALTSQGLFSWKPVSTDLGIDTFIVSVSDGSASIRDTSIITVFGFPFAHVSQTFFDFGSMGIGASVEMKGNISNTGHVPLILQSLPSPVVNTNFAFDSSLIKTVLPGEQKSFTVTYSPTSSGAHGVLVPFSTNDPRMSIFGITAQGTSIAKATVKRKILVDQKHGGPQSPQNSPIGYGFLFNQLEQSGMSIAFADTGLYPSEFDILLSITPFIPYTKIEITRIQDFVKKGGTLITIVDAEYPSLYASIFNSLFKDTAWVTGLSINSPAVVIDTVHNYRGWWEWIQLTDFTDPNHPYLKGVDTLVFFSSTSISVSGNAIPFLRTSPFGRTLNSANIADSIQPAVIGLSKIGKGKILAIGDADVWKYEDSNSLKNPITIANNLQFAMNIFSIVEDYEVKLPNATPNELYQLVSIPFDLENAEISSVLHDLGGINPLVWRLFGRYDPVFGQYSEFPSENFNTFRRGEAYWLITRGQFNLNFGSTTVLPAQDFFPIKIGPGYSMIGNPFPYKVSWKDSQKGDSIQNILWKYNGVTFIPESLAIDQFMGYFVKNLSHDSTTLYINPLDVSGIQIPKSDVTQVFGENEWKVSIGARSGKTGDDFNFAGVSLNAKNEIDKFDVAEPPATPTDYVSVRFNNSSWNSNAGNYAIDIRPISDVGVVWNLDVITSKKQSKVSLSTSTLGNLPNDFLVYLIDKKTERAELIDHTGTYDFAMSKNENHRQFTLVAGKKEFIENNTDGIPLTPKNFALGQNYPNPFNPSTTIRYIVGHSGDVSVTIYNVLGQKVRTLFTEFHSIGTYDVEWDAKDDHGTAVATGVYFYKISVVSNGEQLFGETKKMVLLK